MCQCVDERVFVFLTCVGLSGGCPVRANSLVKTCTEAAHVVCDFDC